MLNIEIIKTKTIPIFKSYGINRAYIFGSFARDEQNQYSDIDFLIEYDPDADFSLFELVGLKYALEEALQRKVDVVTQGALSKYIKNYVLKDKKVIM
ncbi:nucleotidyltransferase [Desulfocucumis palustris]|uniref:Nucleotidyltransferase n=1 Tax=Desulfocucumis palustris TaxID=1898651 RepID=A0A2L2XHE2_9FIRM|nr:nucleotidyltransferase family protein [Desulfocucumis palustris]GBF33646.1 nucleotidyltransferase [Desulfocucumis palustris]